MECKNCGSKNISIERRIDGNVKCNHCKTTWKNSKSYYEQIAKQEEKSLKNQVCSLVSITDENTFAVHYSDGEVKYFTLDEETNECYEQIATQEEKSAKLKQQIDRETASEDQKINMAERVLKLDKLKELG